MIDTIITFMLGTWFGAVVAIFALAVFARGTK